MGKQTFGVQESAWITVWFISSCPLPSVLLGSLSSSLVPAGYGCSQPCKETARQFSYADQSSWSSSLVLGLCAYPNSLAKCGCSPVFSRDLCYISSECATAEDVADKACVEMPWSPFPSGPCWAGSSLPSFPGWSSAPAPPKARVRRGAPCSGLCWPQEAPPCPQSRALVPAPGIPTVEPFLVASCQLAQVGLRCHICPGLLWLRASCLCPSRAHAALPAAKRLHIPWENRAGRFLCNDVKL